MSGEDRPLRIRRILVALDASADSLAGLEAAVRLASELGAGLEGLFVHDETLLRVARLKLGRKVVVASGDARDLAPGELERHLRAQERRAREAFRRAAEGGGVYRDFRVVEGPVARELAAAAREVDLVTVGATGLARREGPGSTVLRLLAEGGRPLLVLRREAPLGASVHAVHDGSTAGAASVRTAAGLRRKGAPLGVLVTVEEPEAARRVVAETAAWLERHGIEARIRRVPGADVLALCGALCGRERGLLVAPGSPYRERRHALARLLREAGCPVVLVAGP